MKTLGEWFGGCILLGLSLALQVEARAAPKEIPDLLKPWESWVVWGDAHPDCPTPYNNPQQHICFWPSQLTLTADANTSSWSIDVTVFNETWMPLPGSEDVWPTNVSAGGAPIVVVLHDGTPSVKLGAGQHQLSGQFVWDEMPQRIAIPESIGVLSLTVDGSEIPIPKWDASGHVWLKRLRAEVADKNQIVAQVYRVVEDGVPLWLRTEVELTVSGQSREEDLGWVLPQGWKLSRVDSPVPVAVDELGRMKAQVRAGKWKIRLDAFRTTDANEIGFAPEAEPIVNLELVGFKAMPDFRMAQLEGVEVMDASQTTFPAEWRKLPVYRWDTRSAFRLVEKMRGMGLQRPKGLSIERRLWLDEDGHGLTFRDRIQGQMQQVWRLDVADDHDLGAVRINGEGQLITANPQTESHGVEIRTRNLNMYAIGRASRSPTLAATGWQTDVEALQLTLVLPPGWRVLALFGADRVEGDWLTAWSLLDLFLLLIFALAVFRIWGFAAGVVAFLAFGLAYHEPGAPRLTWLFLLMPVALLRVVEFGVVRRWITRWKYLAIAFLVLTFVPFLVGQIQSLIYPQLEPAGQSYASRNTFGWLDYRYGRRAPRAEAVVDAIEFDRMERTKSLGRSLGENTGASRQRMSRFIASNLAYDPQAKVQTGPAEPEWNWNQVRCLWNGPVSAEQQIRPILISLPVYRVLTALRLVLLLILVAIVLGVRKIHLPFSRRVVAATSLLFCVCLPGAATAQIPDAKMLSKLRQRLLTPSDAYPQAAEISSVQLTVTDNRIVMKAEVHAAIRVAVPLPGRLPAWSPVSVRVNDQADVPIRRIDGYLWITVPAGIHHVVVEGLLPDVTEWDWTFLLKPRRVSIEAPGWTVTGLRPNGAVATPIFFTRQKPSGAGEVAYDRKDFQVIVAVNRTLETGLVWKVYTRITRLSAGDKAISLRVPLLPGERVLTSERVVSDGHVEVQLGAGKKILGWMSELPVGDEIRLTAPATDRWVERWSLMNSPVWNVTLSGLGPMFESEHDLLIPVWHPWPGESATLSFSKPHAISGDTVTVHRVQHDTSLGRRQRTATMKLAIESSLGDDFVMELDADADIASLNLDGQPIPVRRDGRRLIVPLHPGKQEIDVAWRTSEPMETVSGVGQVALPVEGANVTTVMHLPESRWVLWAEGPLRGPAVRFWTILACAVLAAFVLGSLPQSPLRRSEWMLLTLGLTQVNVGAALVVVAWLFLLAWRGRLDTQRVRACRFDLLQVALVFLTFAMLSILIAVVGQGLLGDPDMFIIGNGSSPRHLQWFQPRSGPQLPVPRVVSISVWFYRLLMLFWALWLASSVLRWLKWGWEQLTHEVAWKRACKRRVKPASP